MAKIFRDEVDSIIRKYIDVDKLSRIETDSNFEEDYDAMLDEIARAGMSILDNVIR